MKKKLFILCMALACTVTLMAQNIAVVNGNNTDLYRTLAEAIEGAAPGSVIYLPGGGFPISDDVQITKSLTIIGIGHKYNNNNSDGVTTISGNLSFKEGSSGSAVIGCYISNNVEIFENVDYVTIKYCNVNIVRVYDVSCLGTTITQCYLRGGANFHGANGTFTHNVSLDVWNLDNGFIEYNIFTSPQYIFGTSNSDDHCEQSYVKGNVILSSSGYYGEDNILSSNMCPINWDCDPEIITIQGSWDDVFINYNGGAISPSSNFHFKDAFRQYESHVGLYADGVQFDKQMAPVPFIVAKYIDEQTDASGNLKIKIRVKASGEE